MDGLEDLNSHLLVYELAWLPNMGTTLCHTRRDEGSSVRHTPLLQQITV
jgi:hypothetical protein